MEDKFVDAVCILQLLGALHFICCTLRCEITIHQILNLLHLHSTKYYEIKTESYWIKTFQKAVKFLFRTLVLEQSLVETLLNIKRKHQLTRQRLCSMATVEEGS